MKRSIESATNPRLTVMAGLVPMGIGIRWGRRPIGAVGQNAIVMAGLVPAICARTVEERMAGTSPAMTVRTWLAQQTIFRPCPILMRIGLVPAIHGLRVDPAEAVDASLRRHGDTFVIKLYLFAKRYEYTEASTAGYYPLGLGS